MGLKEFLLDEDQGVSPVIGVILMVAITVILAAVIATFVMNMGPETNSPPNTQWEWSTNSSDYVTLEHGGGDDVDTNNFEFEGDASGEDLDASDDNMTAGDTETVPGGTYSSGDEIKLVWKDPEGGSSQPVDTYTVP